jgi:hypothetical protein
MQTLPLTLKRPLLLLLLLLRGQATALLLADRCLGCVNTLETATAPGQPASEARGAPNPWTTPHSMQWTDAVVCLQVHCLFVSLRHSPGLKKRAEPVPTD